MLSLVVHGFRVDGSMSVSGFFFFQAEDGIRDLVRSRGLGDVYKRQAEAGDLESIQETSGQPEQQPVDHEGEKTQREQVAVSYTHLTLPTSDLV